MFFNNHMRSVHHVKVTKKPSSLFKLQQRDFLKLYFKEVCKRPTLDTIKHLANFLGVKKESVYWWFFNQNKKFRKKQGKNPQTK